MVAVTPTQTAPGCVFLFNFAMIKWNFRACLLSGLKTSSKNQQFTPVWLKQELKGRDEVSLFRVYHMLSFSFWFYTKWGCNGRGVFCMIGTQHWHFVFFWHGQHDMEVWWWLNVPLFLRVFYTGTNGLVYYMFFLLFLCFPICFKGHLEPLSVS